MLTDFFTDEPDVMLIWDLFYQCGLKRRKPPIPLLGISLRDNKKG